MTGASARDTSTGDTSIKDTSIKEWRILPVDRRGLERTAALHGLCFPGDGWAPEDFGGILAMSGAHGWWAADAADPHLAPLAFLFDLLIPPAGEIITLGVAPAARRRGAARALLSDLIARARIRGIGTLTLEVADDNEAAFHLYDGLGFERIGLRPAYYRRPDGRTVDARLLRRIVLP